MVFDDIWFAVGMYGAADEACGMRWIDYYDLKRGDRVVIEVGGKNKLGFVSKKKARKIRVAFGVIGDRERVWKKFEEVEVWGGKEK